MVMWKRGCEFCHQGAEHVPERAHEQIHELMDIAEQLKRIDRFAEIRWDSIDAGYHDAEDSFLEIKQMLMEATAR